MPHGSLVQVKVPQNHVEVLDRVGDLLHPLISHRISLERNTDGRIGVPSVGHNMGFTNVGCELKAVLICHGSAHIFRSAGELIGSVRVRGLVRVVMLRTDYSIIVRAML